MGGLRYQLQAYWQSDEDRTTAAEYSVAGVHGLLAGTVDQTKDGGEWWSIGQATLKAGKVDIMLKNASGAGLLSADAVRLVLIDQSLYSPLLGGIFSSSQENLRYRQGSVVGIAVLPDPIYISSY